jgi:hypothetical protein
MYCSNCGKELIDGSKFCNDCGTKVDNIEQSNTDSKRKIIFDGKIHKCPNCGSKLNSFEHKCKDCGYELRGSNLNNVVMEFANKLEKVDSISKKNELISNFYIPNTKEDIYEFFILAISNLKTDSSCEEAWKSKLEQTYHKAKLSFGNSPEFEYVDKLYVKTMKSYRRHSINKIIKTGWKYVLGLLISALGIGIIVYGIFIVSEIGDDDSPYYMLIFLGVFILGAGISIFRMGFKKSISSNSEDEENDEE